MSAAQPSRVPMLDVLRAVAIFAVFVQHLGDRFRPFVLRQAGGVLPAVATGWIEAILTHGHWGVDLFFVLSGFTLGLGFVRQYDKRAPARTAAFFARRAARILPAFYVALAIHLALHPGLFRDPAIWRSLAVHAAVLQGYLSPGRVVLIGASWSLTTEAHFYVLAPLLARWLLAQGSPLLDNPRARWNPRRLAVFATAVCVGAWLLRAALHDYALLPQAHPGLLELSQRRWVVTRVDQFVVGLAAALVYVRVGVRLAAHRMALLVAAGGAVLLLGVAAPLDAATYSRPGGGLAYPLVTFGMGLLVLAAACMRAQSGAAVLAPLQWVGVVSYGVFLYHQLALELAGRWLPGARGDASWTSLALTATTGAALACLAGWLSWKWLESPVLAWVSRKLQPPAAAGRRAVCIAPDVSPPAANA